MLDTTHLGARLLAICFALSALFTTACGRGSLTACTRDRDCPSPQTCQASVCVNSGCGVGASTCIDDSACGSGQRCASGCCVAGTPGTCARDSDCQGRTGTPVCDTSTSSCVPCLVASDCGPGRVCTNKTCVGQAGCYSSADCKDTSKPLCDVASRSCVQCLSAADCSDHLTPNCDATHTCVGDLACQSDNDCKAPTGRCNTSNGACVACLTNRDCTNGVETVCNGDNICVRPAASTCTVDADCASNPDQPHCLPGNGTTVPGTCVACTSPDQCQPGQDCAHDNTCQKIVCASDDDCVNPATPKCDTTASNCVACLGDGDCPNGSTCQADHTCQAQTNACKKDDDCASNVSAPHCKVASSGTNVCVACRNPGDCGAGVTCPNDCGAQAVCTLSNTCLSIACASDNDCTQPTRPHCKGGGSSATGVCVACTTAAQCGAGERCTSDNQCVPVCTAASEAQDCPTNTPKCKESPAGNSCVQCLTNAQCSGATPTCSATNTCIPTPQTGCQSDNDCPAGQHKCDTSVSPHACVQCLSTPDCTNGDLCTNKTCAPPPLGGLGEQCRTDNSCDSGLICVDEGGANPVCRLLCDPNTATSCASVPGSVCEWYAFDDSNTFYGFCEGKNGHGALGAACDPTQFDSCEWNLLCAPTTASTGVCAALCKPGTACASGVCNSIVGALDADGNALAMGYCGANSTWGHACVSDTSSGGPDCGDALSKAGVNGLYCTPTTLLAEEPATNVVATCAYTPQVTSATGGANDSCVQHGGNDCRTGVCLSGPGTCFAGCQFNADCTRDSGSYCFDVGFFTDVAESFVGSCEPTCLADFSCAAVPGTSCQPQPTHGGNSWRAVCGLVAGSGKAGARCSGSSDCASGVCLTASIFESIALGQSLDLADTDGLCLGSCTQQSDCVGSGTVCNTSFALPMTPLDTGDLAVFGRPNPGICSGTSCTTDANCAGFSADTSTPRVCAPYKIESVASNDSIKKCTADSDCTGQGTGIQAICNTTANNDNPGGVYGTNAGIYGPNGRCRAITWGLHCAPSLGATLGGPGASCSAGADCRTGRCIKSSTGSTYCFGGCSADTDCLNGTHCKTGTFLGLTSKYCAP
ncbi:MAG: hypothetical protein JST92_02970 [Deltaproteobacteria bacterium]|nr:hypothetical protein [Deltaproteobacteria bacterium]